MQKPVYFYKSIRPERPVALINVRLVDGKLPPILKWLDSLYYWKEPLGEMGGYYSWLLDNDIDKVQETDVIEDFRRAR